MDDFYRRIGFERMPWNDNGSSGFLICHDIDENNVESIERKIGSDKNRFIKKYSKSYLLHHAISENKPVIVNRLLDAGMDPNSQNSSGETPLHLCISKRRSNMLDMVQQLISAGANKEHVDLAGNTPLEACLSCTYDSPMLVEVVKYLIIMGANIHTSRPGCTVYTPLYLCYNNAAFRLLLEAGAEITDAVVLKNIFDPMKMEILLEYGLDVNREITTNTYNKVFEHRDLFVPKEVQTTVLEIIQEKVDQIKQKNVNFIVLNSVKKYNYNNKATIIQSCARVFLAKKRVLEKRASPEMLFDKEYRDIRMKMLELKGF